MPQISSKKVRHFTKVRKSCKMEGWSSTMLHIPSKNQRLDFRNTAYTMRNGRLKFENAATGKMEAWIVHDAVTGMQDGRFIQKTANSKDNRQGRKHENTTQSINRPKANSKRARCGLFRAFWYSCWPTGYFPSSAPDFWHSAVICPLASCWTLYIYTLFCFAFLVYCPFSFLPQGVRELGSQIYVYSFGIASVSSFLAKSFVDDTLALFLEICTGELAQGSSCLGIKSQGSEPKAAVGNPFFLCCVSRTELLIDDSPWISLGIVSVFSGLNISRKVGVSYLSSPLHSKCWGGSGAIVWVWARYVLLRP